MTTVRELALDALGSFGTSENVIAVAKWIDNRYREMFAQVKFRNLRKIGELTIPAIVDDGTVDCTRGSTTVSGTSTTVETDVGSGSQEYYYFKTLQAWYLISSVTSETEWELSSAFAEDDVDDGTYQIVKRYHPLASDARWLGKIVIPRLKVEFDPVSLEELDIEAPGRPYTGGQIQTVAQVGFDSNGYVMVEAYPPPTNTELFQYVYWSLPTSLSITSTIPSVIEPYVLKEGVLVDIYRLMMNESIKKGNVEAAALYGNHMRSQETRWRKAMREVRRTTTGVDDVTLVLDWFKKGTIREQRTARDYIHDNWTGSA